MRHRIPEKAAVAETMKRRITAREASESSSSEPGRAHRKKAKKKPAKPKIEQYPFPATYHDASEEPESASAAPGERRIPQMRTQKARDGGRTQSGGVRGILRSLLLLLSAGSGVLFAFWL